MVGSSDGRHGPAGRSPSTRSATAPTGMRSTPSRRPLSEWHPHGLRPRIEHAQLLHPTDIARFAELGVACSVQFSHAPSDRDLADRFWPTEIEGAYAFRSLWESGALVVNGSDAPIEELDPLLGIRAAALRTLDDRPPWHPEEALTVEQALIATTANPPALSWRRTAPWEAPSRLPRRSRRARPGSGHLSARGARGARGRRDDDRRALGSQSTALVGNLPIQPLQCVHAHDAAGSRRGVRGRLYGRDHRLEVDGDHRPRPLRRAETLLGARTGLPGHQPTDALRAPRHARAAPASSLARASPSRRPGSSTS